MGDLLKTFTFDRNTVKASAEQSASAVAAHIELVQAAAPLSKTSNNIIGALTNFMGVFDSGQVSAVGEAFLKIAKVNSPDGWRWLVTRSLWRYPVPNGTASHVNSVATNLGVQFSFFHTLLAILTLLDSHVEAERFLYYDEFCRIFDDDSAWARSADSLYSELMVTREGGQATERRPFLGNLETEYGIPRDNLNGTFKKLLGQTGLFDFAIADGQPVGIAIAGGLDAVLRRRIRHVLDHKTVWDDSSPWPAFLGVQPDDMPIEASRMPSKAATAATSDVGLTDPEVDVENLAAAAVEAFTAAGLYIEIGFVTRLLASLLTKRLVILTGLTGSGKTKVAQALAAWLTPRVATAEALFEVGEVVDADRTSYEVVGTDSLSVEFKAENGVLVSLPISLIRSWAQVIRENTFNETTPPRTIRQVAEPVVAYSPQLNSFESHLKAAAFHLLDKDGHLVDAPCYEVVAVGADWTSGERILGYPDALDPKRYVKTQVLELILRARRSDHPHFLILDEMNLSHVERYFADFLSALESGEDLELYPDSEVERLKSGVPPRMTLPSNMFVIGTVNVDETTYMFSPKVLDRANCLEFRVSAEDMPRYLENAAPVTLTSLHGAGEEYGLSFLAAAISVANLDADLSASINAEIELIFQGALRLGGEFGYRTAFEVRRFAYFHRLLSGADWRIADSVDAQILQKLLPKLHGSRRALESILLCYAAFAYIKRDWVEEAGKRRIANSALIDAGMRSAIDPATPAVDPLAVNDGLVAVYPGANAEHPLAYEKVGRMLRLLVRDGFASFAEA